MSTLLLTASFAAPAPLPEAPPPVPAEVPPSQWTRKFYAQPRGNVRAIAVNGRTGAQALVGLEGGLRYVHLADGRPDVAGRTRAQADGLYGLTANSFGYGLRLGSFIGPTSKIVTWQAGPDLWANQYGRVGALDYHLPFSVGLDLSNVLTFHVDPRVNATIGLTPGWAFDKDRQGGGLGPFHELSAFVAVAVSAGGFSFVVGYAREYNAAGTTDGLILSGGF